MLDKRLAITPSCRPPPPYLPLLPQGDEAFHCERCHLRTPATKHLRVHRFPEVLLLHIKRMRFKHKVRGRGRTTGAAGWRGRCL